MTTQHSNNLDTMHKFNPDFQVGVKVKYKNGSRGNKIYVIKNNSMTDPCLSDDEVEIVVDGGYYNEGLDVEDAFRLELA